MQIKAAQIDPNSPRGRILTLGNEIVTWGQEEESTSHTIERTYDPFLVRSKLVDLNVSGQAQFDARFSERIRIAMSKLQGSTSVEQIRKNCLAKALTVNAIVPCGEAVKKAAVESPP
jgi:hypothetical protein